MDLVDEDFGTEIAGVTTKPSVEVHIRIQAYKRKCLTLVEGLPPKLNLKKVLQFFKRQFCCNGNIVQGGSTGNVVQLQGDKRTDVQNFLIEQKICERDQIVVHGAQL
jgi:translation initiation factor SUI1